MKKYASVPETSPLKGLQAAFKVACKWLMSVGHCQNCEWLVPYFVKRKLNSLEMPEIVKPQKKRDQHSPGLDTGSRK